MPEISTGTEAPIAMPRITGSAILKVISPVLESACRIPTDADALCRIAVKTIPIRMPRNGLVKLVRNEIKPGVRSGIRGGDYQEMTAEEFL